MNKDNNTQNPTEQTPEQWAKSFINYELDDLKKSGEFAACSDSSEVAELIRDELNYYHSGRGELTHAEYGLLLDTLREMESEGLLEPEA